MFFFLMVVCSGDFGAVCLLKLTVSASSLQKIICKN